MNERQNSIQMHAYAHTLTPAKTAAPGHSVINSVKGTNFVQGSPQAVT